MPSLAALEVGVLCSNHRDGWLATEATRDRYRALTKTSPARIGRASEATVKRYHHDSHRQFEAHLADFVSAYNFGRRLKTLKGLTPCEFICKLWTAELRRFRLNPLHQMPGLNIDSRRIVVG